jgi:hypothetical protein
MIRRGLSETGADIMRESAPSEYDPRSAPPRWPVTPQPAAESALESATVVRRPARRRSFVGDISAGLFLGDFAHELGLPGAVTQIVISFVPLIGSICAVRDLTADLRHHDHLGAALNALALTPVLGGFSKTFEVIRNTAHVGHAVHTAHQQAQRRRDGGAA